MRVISFVDNLELLFNGNVLERGLTLGDVDNDGNSEFIVANVEGNLSIFKNDPVGKPWRQFEELGMVSCVVVGDICGTGDNVLFCGTCEGWCHLMSFASHHNPLGDDTSDTISKFHQCLPTNSKVAIIADVDGDGMTELVTGSTDRVVRVFKWVPEPTMTVDSVVVGMPTTVCEKSGKVLKKQSSNDGYLARSTSKDAEDIPEKNLKTQEKTSSLANQAKHSSLFDGKLVCVKRWKLSGQIESLSVVEGCNGSSPAILVSQPSGSYLYLVCVEDEIKQVLEKQIKQLTIQDSAFSFSDCHISTDTSTPYCLLADDSMPSIPTHVINWKFKPTHQHQTTMSNFVAMCTLNGTLAILRDNKILWSLELPHNFCSMYKLDITASGRDDIVFCAWNGETFIIDQYQNIVNFKLGENIMAFCAGNYAVQPGKEAPCLVYVTFSGRIKLYCNVTMPGLESRNFTDTVVAKLGKLNLDPVYRDFMESKDGSLDNKKIKQLTNWCLYGGPPPDLDHTLP